jgi:tetratricopeptide (TPR) repeat protein
MVRLKKNMGDSEEYSSKCRVVRRGVCLGFLCCVLGATLLASTQEQHSLEVMSADANAAYVDQKWGKAQLLYERLVQIHPESYRYWYRLGVCRRRQKEYERAIEAFQKAQALGTPASIVGYDIAATYAAMGQPERATERLTDAVKQGYAQPDEMSNDLDLRSIREDPRFRELLEQAKRNQTPCSYSAENRQFDFWVGDWDVVTTRESVSVGSSHIEKAVADCVIWENWTSLGTGYTGKSYNVYNADQKRWEQFWVDSTRGMIHFYGALKNQVMDFYTDEIPQSDGTKLKRHLQFFNLGPDTVRQFSQGSTDSGTTWADEYDFTYNRRKK